MVRRQREDSSEPCTIKDGRKQGAGDATERPIKRRRTAADPSPVLSCWLRSGKRRANADGESPTEKGRWSSTSDPTDLQQHNTCVEHNMASDSGDMTSGSMLTICTDPSINSANKDSKAADSNGDITHIFNHVSPEEERIFVMSSSANTSRGDFEDKYIELGVIGAGGLGSVNSGFRKSDLLPVAIKHIPTKNVRVEQVQCNGVAYHVILEVALMLKSASLPGEVGQSTTMSLLDWYLLDSELLLVMETPAFGKDLWKYCQTKGGFLEEREAKILLKELVDAAIDLHAKGVFHRDIKLQNVLVDLDSGKLRARLIDFGCGTFSTEETFRAFFGTPMYAPPEWFEYTAYWARPTTVWQLGVLFYSLLKGHEPFITTGFLDNSIQINHALSRDCKTLLNMCLAIDPMKRATLEDLQLCPALNQTKSPHTQHHLDK